MEERRPKPSRIELTQKQDGPKHPETMMSRGRTKGDREDPRGPRSMRKKTSRGRSRGNKEEIGEPADCCEEKPVKVSDGSFFDRETVKESPVERNQFSQAGQYPESSTLPRPQNLARFVCEMLLTIEWMKSERRETKGRKSRDSLRKGFACSKRDFCFSMGEMRSLTI
ncbi:hypothetical protein VTK73DRAFT_10132 [Phialemonium thermophilum]|uniref:Uncharacterized protein n=1 Tax=Phialemonium thermophilum TaxID=223376 RepID=A0ABR3VYC7_9PEZI